MKNAKVMLISVTRLRVRLLWYLPSFLWMTYLTQRQIVRAAGFRGGRLLLDAHNTYWTVTVWESERAMKAYRGSQAHGKAMPRLAGWCDEGAYARWTQESDALPAWEDAWERLKKDGRLSPVAHPSADHQARVFPKPRLEPLIERGIKPVS